MAFAHGSPVNVGASEEVWATMLAARVSYSCGNQNQRGRYKLCSCT
jgi:hypothetical protein